MSVNFRDELDAIIVLQLCHYWRSGWLFNVCSLIMLIGIRAATNWCCVGVANGWTMGRRFIRLLAMMSMMHLIDGLTKLWIIRNLSFTLKIIWWKCSSIPVTGIVSWNVCHNREDTCIYVSSSMSHTVKSKCFEGMSDKIVNISNPIIYTENCYKVT